LFFELVRFLRKRDERQKRKKKGKQRHSRNMDTMFSSKIGKKERTAEKQRKIKQTSYLVDKV
jgi:hypothetical protein